MNSLSNIEIVNFDQIENNEENYMGLEHEIEMNYTNNFIIDKYESDYSEIQNDVISYDLSCNMTICSDILINKSAPEKNNNKYRNNPNLSNVYDSCNNSNIGDATNFSENKSLIQNDSFCKDINSISDKKPTKFKINSDNESYFSNKSNNSASIKSFPCTFEKCDKIYKSKENLTLHYKNIHLKEKPYSCKFCNSIFSHRNGN